MRSKILAMIFLLISPLTLGADTTDVERLLGPLPKPGNLSDVLECAGVNEVAWLTITKIDPYSHEGNEAKRKASWYAAVALWVFAVESQAVVDAVNTAQKREYSEVIKVANQCRKAPSNWRE